MEDNLGSAWNEGRVGMEWEQGPQGGYGMGAGWIWNEGTVGVEWEQGVTYLSTTSGLGQPSYLV